MPQPNDVSKTVNSAVRRAEEAIRLMVWKENPAPRPAGIIRSFIGEIIAADPSGKQQMTWLCISCAYLDEQREVRFDGAVTDCQKGVLLHLPQPLAEIAVGLAETALKIPPCTTPGATPGTTASET